MTENENDASADAETQTEEQSQTDWKERAEYLERQFKDAVKKRDRQAEELRALKEQVNSSGKEQAKSDNNIGKLEAHYKAELDKLSSELTTTKKNLENELLTSRVSRLALNKLSDSGTEAFLKLYSDQFEIVESESGSLEPKLKNSFNTLEKEITEFAEKFPGFKPNNLKTGTGSKSNTSKENGFDVSEVNSMGWKEMMKLTPEQRKIIKANVDSRSR